MAHYHQLAMLSVTAMVSSCLAIETLRGQDANTGRVHRPMPMVKIRLSDGQFEVQNFGVVAWNNQEEVLLLLTHNSIRAELELLPEQQTELDALVARTRQSMAELTKGVSFGNPPPGLPEVLAQEAARFQSALEEIFLPHQRVAMRQLMTRLTIRRMGLLHELFQGDLGKQLGVPLERANDILREGREIADRFRPSVDELRREYFQRFMALLSERQRQEISPLGPEFMECRLPPLEAISWQLQNADELHRRSKEWPDLPYRGLSIPVLFKVDLDGQLVLFNPELSDEQLRRMAADGRHFHADTILVSLKNESWLAKELQLSDGQLAIYDELLTQMKEAHDQMHTRMASLPDAEKALAARAMDEERNRVGDEVLAVLKRTLDPRQAQALEHIAEVAEVVRGGMRYALIYGQLGKRLAITPAQRDAIVRESEALANEIRQQAQTIENEVLDAVRQALGPEAREKLDDLMGPELKTIPGNIGLLLEQLTYPFGR